MTFTLSLENEEIYISMKDPDNDELSLIFFNLNLINLIKFINLIHLKVFNLNRIIFKNNCWLW